MSGPKGTFRLKLQTFLKPQPKHKGPSARDRVGIVQAIQTPLGFFVLVVLVVEVVFGIVAGLREGPDRTYLVIGMIALMFFVVALVGFLAYSGRGLGPRSDRSPQKEVFHEKCTYIKVVHLSKNEEGRPPIYTRFIQRLNKSVDVYDELVYFTLNCSSQPLNSLTFTVRSSGLVDPRSFYPWVKRLEFADRDSEFVESMVQADVSDSSQTYGIVTHHFNGLQPATKTFPSEWTETRGTPDLF